MVVLLRMVAVYLFSRLSDLFHDEEVRFTFYDPFDLWLFVAGNHNEVVALLHDGLIAAGGISIVSKQDARPHSQ